MDYTEIVASYYLMMGQLLLAQQEPGKQRRKRRWWVRERLGAANALQPEIILSDPENFQDYIRMSKEQFENLLEIVGPHLEKMSIRKPISAEQRLLVTLRFVATGASYSALGDEFRIGKATVHNIIKETTVTIWESLHADYVKSPTIEEMQETASLFYAKTGVPNCVGAIGGKHYIVHAPAGRKSLQRNDKHAFSIIFLAACDANYLFTYADIGAFGSKLDAERSDSDQNLFDINLPEDSFLPNSTVKFPHFFAADKGFPLKPNLLRPYGSKNFTEDKKFFNTYLSTVHQHIERAFGILVSNFRIYHTSICASADNAPNIVKCTVALHNYIRRTSNNLENSSISDGWPMDLGNWESTTGLYSSSNHPAAEPSFLRDQLKDYLCKQSNQPGSD